ncbi:MAG: redoxin domain-containing protein [Gammaproteobacteria bacterium]|jgi:alkyl hydroperoxide reductase subunit AhpC|nr:redoxin domain-containing protein [Gammaproteobacteria bacterium]MBU0770067.1 redoxin domain-containing protein [Gammaproteobacteria bacterium]MBU0855624.1 redoxin domain-containing protein [Gammaproteobacteria bacterium]MBU1848540.1 redoxin domain-containing protein [Gammaproteobacteria bacterium]
MTSLVGRVAPDFTDEALWDDGSSRPFTLSSMRGGCTVLVFDVPGDTLPARSGLVAFGRRLPDFVRRRAGVVACVPAPVTTIAQWRARAGAGVPGYPLVADARGAIGGAYGADPASRSIVLIDRDGVVRYRIASTLAPERDIDATLCAIDALQQTPPLGEAQPFGAYRGRAARPLPDRNTAKYLAEHSDML